MSYYYIRQPELHSRTCLMVERIMDQMLEMSEFLGDKAPLPRIYGVPRGGVPVAYLLQGLMKCELVDSPDQADFIVDDIIDSGATRDSCPQPFFALVDKTKGELAGQWVVFPWEADPAKGEQDDSIVGTLRNRLITANMSHCANDNISAVFQPGDLEQLQVIVAKRAEALLDSLLIDRENDPNTRGTAVRIAKLYCRELFAGRFQPMPAVTYFPNTKQLDELYVSPPITIRSTCSHHFCPIVGKAWIGVLPGKKLIGLSKFNRVVDWIASRPQIQEEMTVQIADELECSLEPAGLAVIVKANHSCMTWRGVKEEAGGAMVTSVMRGMMREVPSLKNEFLRLVEL